jgi:hypothetical protein
MFTALNAGRSRSVQISYVEEPREAEIQPYEADPPGHYSYPTGSALEK